MTRDRLQALSFDMRPTGQPDGNRCRIATDAGALFRW